jgi:hypothetical protein
MVVIVGAWLSIGGEFNTRELVPVSHHEIMHGRLTIGQPSLYVVSIFTDHPKKCLLKPPAEAPDRLRLLTG